MRKPTLPTISVTRTRTSGASFARTHCCSPTNNTPWPIFSYDCYNSVGSRRVLKPQLLTGRGNFDNLYL
jgi:hypothetical protein